jgi:hypothetical protein
MSVQTPPRTEGATAVRPLAVAARNKSVKRSGLADRISYWLIGSSIYLTFGTLFYYGAYGKLVTDSGTMPTGLAKAYSGTFVTSFPGVNTSWLLMGILEGVIFLGFIFSILKGEFLPTRRKPVLLSSLGLSMLTFAIIAWAENITGGFATVSELFIYLVGSAVLVMLVLLMPPYRKTNWLSGLVSREDAVPDESV